jgi:hypothetical protein
MHLLLGKHTWLLTKTEHEWDCRREPPFLIRSSPSPPTPILSWLDFPCSRRLSWRPEQNRAGYSSRGPVL